MPPSTSSSDAPGDGQEAERRTILLVEDNPDTALLVQHAFDKQPVPVTLQVCQDGAQALARLQGENGDEQPLPALVLLDLKMPRMSGHEVLARIRSHARTRRTPVVIFTSSSEPEDVAQAYDAGANSYLCKPVDFKELVATLESVARYWLHNNEAPGNQG